MVHGVPVIFKILMLPEEILIRISKIRDALLTIIA